MAQRTSQRSFIFAIHPTHGLLLLRAYKKKKGTHHQLPGGRVDADELEYEDAHRRAAARELREETGIDVPPARLMDTAVRRKNREYFFLELRDADGAGPDRDHANAENPFTLALSGEHTGFTFERDLAKAEDMIRLHSGGENALASRSSPKEHSVTKDFELCVWSSRSCSFPTSARAPPAPMPAPSFSRAAHGRRAPASPPRASGLAVEMVAGAR